MPAVRLSVLVLVAALPTAQAEAQLRDWTARSDRSLDAFLISNLDGRDPAESAEIVEGLALRDDLSVGAFLQHFLAAVGPTAQAKAEYLMRVLLGSFFPADAPAELLARRAAENREALEATVSRLATFHDLALRAEVVRLLPLVRNPAVAAAAEAADLTDTLARQGGLLVPVQAAYALALLDALAAAADQDLLPIVLRMAQACRTPAVLRRAREVARGLVGPPALPAGAALP